MVDRMWRENICSNYYEEKAAKTFCISKSSRRNSTSSDVKYNSSHKFSSSNTPVIKIMLKCVLELADKDLKPQIKAESLSIINRILGSVPSVLQRQIMRNILLHMGLEDILPSLSNYKCVRLNDELLIFEKGRQIEEVIHLSKSGKHPLNTFSEAYMKLAKNKNYLASFMEFIEKIASGLDITKKDVLFLYSLLPKRCKKEESLKEEECFTKSLSNNNTVNDKRMLGNEIIAKTSKKLKEDNKNLPYSFHRSRTMSVSSKYPETIKERVPLFKKKTVDVEVQTESSQRLSLDNSMETNEYKPLKTVKDKNEPPMAPPLPNFLKDPNSTGKVFFHIPANESTTAKSTNNNLLPPPPPPPPLLKKANGGNSKFDSQKNLLNTEESHYREVSIRYSKFKTTNTVQWTPVKLNSLENKTTIWSNFVEPEFKESERSKIELVFEKPHKISRRLTIATLSRFPRENIKLNGNNNRLVTKGLSEKRALNLGIVLSRFKLKGVNLVNALDSEKCHTFDIDLLSNLLLQYPTEEEKKYFENINESNTLNTTEAFVWAVARKPHLKIKLELLVFEANFSVDAKNYIQTGEKCLDICKKLYKNPNIENFFYKCLQIGNFLNQDSFNGNARGFTLTSFINILTFKGTVTNKNSTTRIIDLLVESEIFDVKEMNQLYDKLESIKSFDLNDFETMSNKLNQQLLSIRTKIEATESFLTEKETSSIFANYVTMCCKLKQLTIDIKSLENNLQNYYCADKLKLEEIIHTLLQGFDLFKKANLVYERNKVQSERYSKTIQSFGKPLSKLKRRIVKVDS
uniref:FH2 domain-containing protein n=1 Tax=Strongyloides stercoralis TaxID=6248 RepID=A0AAF5D974_STRER